MRTDRLGLIAAVALVAAAWGCGDQQDGDQNACQMGDPITCVDAEYMRYCDGRAYVLAHCPNGCNMALGRCVVETAGSCQSLSCPVGQMCDASTGTCVSITGCGTACPTGYQCVTQPSEMCVPSRCLNDNACPNGFICEASTCVYGSREPDCANGQCSQPGCKSDAECGAGRQCVSGVCQTAPKDECLKDSDCASGFGCVSRKCVELVVGDECAQDDDCGEDQYCVDGFCYDEDDVPDCLKDSDCGSGEICYDEMCIDPKELYECAKDSDCSAGEVCIEGFCESGQEEVECIDDSDCDEDEMCLAGTCVGNQEEPECIYDDDCLDGETCEDSTCVKQSVPAECAEDGSYPRCEDNAVVTCDQGRLVRTACGSLKECRNGACVDKACTAGTKTCQNGMLATCTSGRTWELSACGTGEICLDGACVAHGTEPAVKTCGTLNKSGSNACELSGYGKKIVLRGDVLGHDQTWLGGSVVIEGSKITYVGCDPDLTSATVITCPDAVISPALINGHEHITFSNGMPRNWGEERFDHRNDWRLGQHGHTKVPGGNTSAGNGNSVVEMRALLAGTTSIFGSGSAPGLARNLDVKSSTIGGVTSVYQTFPLGDSDNVPRESGCDYKYHSSVLEMDEGCPYGPHIAEGINQAALNELRCLSGEGDSKARDIFKPNLAVIHGIGATVDIIQKMADNQVKLIWSPRTNISLYGDTAQAPLYDRMGVTIGLGTDWLYSGSANLLRELKCVDHMNRNYYSRYFTDYQIWLMPTWNNAVAFGVDKYIGKIETGYYADISIFRKTPTRDRYRAVIDAESEDVLLVMKEGVRIYGDANIMESGETIDICEVSKKFDFKAADAKKEITGMAVLEAAAQYKMYFCKAPENEPTCTPKRTRITDTEDQQTTLYDGNYSAANDADGDGIPNHLDNCPTMFNPIRPMDTARKQADADGDTIGDICDLYPNCKANDASCGGGGPVVPADDRDGDGIPDSSDNCPDTPNADQNDADNDGKGDVCDLCPTKPNPGSASCPSETAYTVDFSCSECKSGPTGYKGVYTETFDDIKFEAHGNYQKYQQMQGITINGDPASGTRIDVTGLDGLGTLMVSYISYNPTGGTGTLNITAGDHKAQIIHTYDKVNVQEEFQIFTFDDKNVTSFSLVPEAGKSSSSHRVHITEVTWTVP
ncbi:MAG: amidohydrolase family protein [Proteobacteria bacterium]|nr:amidohydrolase family protein [Pseudomonadota bacterium]